MTPTRHRARRWATATVVSLGLALSTLAASPAAPASADEAADAPVTAPDKVTVYAGGDSTTVGVVDVIANDTDPQGDRLEVCRVGKSPAKHLDFVVSGTYLGVIAGRRTKPGTYQVTYYACDFDYLTPGTVTVTVKRVKKVRVTKIPGRPGKLRVVNPNDRRVVVLWGNQQDEKPDGRLAVAPGRRAVITVKRERIEWMAYIPRIFVVVGMGTVRNIRLPKGADRAAPAHSAPLPPRAQRLWDARR